VSAVQLVTTSDSVEIGPRHSKEWSNMSLPDPEPLSPLSITPDFSELWLMVLAVAGWRLAGAFFALLIRKSSITNRKEV